MRQPLDTVNMTGYHGSDGHGMPRNRRAGRVTWDAAGGSGPANRSQPAPGQAGHHPFRHPKRSATHPQKLTRLSS